MLQTPLRTSPSYGPHIEEDGDHSIAGAFDRSTEDNIFLTVSTQSMSSTATTIESSSNCGSDKVPDSPVKNQFSAINEHINSDEEDTHEDNRNNDSPAMERPSLKKNLYNSTIKATNSPGHSDVSVRQHSGAKDSPNGKTNNGPVTRPASIWKWDIDSGDYFDHTSNGNIKRNDSTSVGPREPVSDPGQSTQHVSSGDHLPNNVNSSSASLKPSHPSNTNGKSSTGSVPASAVPVSESSPRFSKPVSPGLYPVHTNSSVTDSRNSSTATSKHGSASTHPISRLSIPFTDHFSDSVRQSIDSALAIDATKYPLVRAHSGQSSLSRPREGGSLTPLPSGNKAFRDSMSSVNSPHGDLDRRNSLTSFHRPSFSLSSRRKTSPTIGLPPPPSSSQVSTKELDRIKEMIKYRREAKKKRKEFIENGRVLVGTEISEGHDNFVTAYNMLTGIRVSVSRCNAKVDRELVDADFTAAHKLAFDISGNEQLPSAKYDFKFKDYSPWVFRHLRDLFRLDPADYLMSLTSKYIVSQLGSPGKSGSFFYYSRDFRFIIKTIHHSEHKMLRKVLKGYYEHVRKYPDTLISQFYGLHRVKTPFGRKTHFIVMNNIFPPHRDIHRTYDLKGSTLGREFIDQSGRKQSGHKVERKTIVYKDVNWIHADEKIRLGPSKREKFFEQLMIDVELLKKFNVMDYSLLIGIHDMNRGNSESIRDNTLSVFEPGSLSSSKVVELRKALAAASPTALKEFDFVLDEYNRSGFTFYSDSGGFRASGPEDEPLEEIYYMGVIDYLTPYGFRKKVETFWKGLSHSRNAISAIPAVEYGDRFLKFIKSIVTVISKEAKEEMEKCTSGESSKRHSKDKPTELASNGTYDAQRGRSHEPETGSSKIQLHNRDTHHEHSTDESHHEMRDPHAASKTAKTSHDLDTRHEDSSLPRVVETE